MTEDQLFDIYLPKGPTTSFSQFKKHLEEKFERKVLKFLYKDDDGDDISITNDIEFQEFLRFAANNDKFEFEPIFEESAVPLRCPKPDVPVHPAVCDNCNQRIKGIRYKCSNCPNFDLCEACEAKNIPNHIHPQDHLFLKMYIPLPPHRIGIYKTLPNFYTAPMEQLNSASPQAPEPQDSVESRIDKLETSLNQLLSLLPANCNDTSPKAQPPCMRRKSRTWKKEEAIEMFVSDRASKKAAKQRKKIARQHKKQQQAEILSQERNENRQKNKEEVIPEDKNVEETKEPQELKSEKEELVKEDTKAEPKEEEFKVEPIIPDPKPTPEVHPIYEETLRTLDCMGFTNRALNIELLTVRKGDLSSVIEELLA